LIELGRRQVAAWKFNQLDKNGDKVSVFYKEFLKIGKKTGNFKTKIVV
jgi:hypothetical protein